jgi:hypothetical protein
VLPLTLCGCAYKTWWNPPFTAGYNPNAPVGDSENMRRALGGATVETPLHPEPGDIWPGPLPPAPTLRDLEQQAPMGGMPEQPVPGSPLSRGIAPPGGVPYPSPQPSIGSSVPPGSNQPPLAQPQTVPPLSGYAAPAAPPPGRVGGQIIQLPGGTGVTTGGGPGYQTTTTPGGGSAIVVPNGNGTSTVIHSDGRIETVPTPK